MGAHTYRGLCERAAAQGWIVAIYADHTPSKPKLMALAVFISRDEKKSKLATARASLDGRSLDSAAESCMKQLEQAKLL